MENMSVLEIWEIKYQGTDVPKHFNWWEWKQAQKFVDEVDIISIVFYATGLTEAVNGRAQGTGRLYEETLTKDDLAGVSQEWIDDRRKKLEMKFQGQI